MMQNKQPIFIIQGAQYGSEGKGMVAAAFCQKFDVRFAVRTGAVNAGHTVYVADSDVPLKMQQLPTGFVNPHTQLVIGPGALIHPEILNNEVAKLEACGFEIRKRLFIDARAGVHLNEHILRSTKSGRHHAIGATGKGCSEALVDRIKRRGTLGTNLFRDHSSSYNYNLCDTTQLLNDAYDKGERILLEGTQGSLLDLYLGPYPYTTHKPCQASTWIQEAGLSPALEYDIVLVARTYPIRVAGNSGPLPGEIEWSELARRLNNRLQSFGKLPIVAEEYIREWERACREAMAHATHYRVPRSSSEDVLWRMAYWPTAMREEFKECASELHRDAFQMLSAPVQAGLRQLFEFTTVTNKLRRIAEFDRGEFNRAVMWNRPATRVLTFYNYYCPELWGETEFDKGYDGYGKQIGADYITTGPRSEHLVECKNRGKI